MWRYRRFTGSARSHDLPRSVFTLTLEGTASTPASVRTLVAGLEYSTGAVILRTHIFGQQVRLTIRSPLYRRCKNVSHRK